MKSIIIDTNFAKYGYNKFYLFREKLESTNFISSYNKLDFAIESSLNMVLPIKLIILKIGAKNIMDTISKFSAI